MALDAATLALTAAELDPTDYQVQLDATEAEYQQYAVIANGVSLVNFMSAVIPLTIFFQSTNQPSARTIRKRL